MTFNFKDERGFQKWLIAFYKDQGCHIVDLQDENKKGNPSAADKKPYDMGVVCDGRYNAFELKHCKSKTFNAKKVRKHQIEGLKSVENAGGCGFVLVYHIFRLKGKIHEFLSWYIPADSDVNFLSVLKTTDCTLGGFNCIDLGKITLDLKREMMEFVEG